MNPDFAIVLNFKLKDTKKVNADLLVKTARDIGARAVSADSAQTAMQAACAKYTITLAADQAGQDLTADNVINELVTNRKKGQATIINVNITESGTLTAASQAVLEQINNWMHMFGHAFNESKPCSLTTDGNSFVLQNRHMPYQKYLFVKSPLPKQITVSGLTQEPNRVEWIEKRVDLKFNYENNELVIDLADPVDSFPWQVLRIQEHRPEDDIKETKF
ncbi:hypothetical protein OZY43_01190 [Lactobacillus sp. ESL0785]|uniref:hypothetical protein n=1 Tax=Lactobacillus sp. ESL0785 TaxID=2983232 RepID=UPI0023F8C280|nr:hypothetical protein [Lactobacillus sp. ESL0785]WEV71083.1 hypothetical protein OZY43_01190 [Lactobacillus sp. ESL0785]